MNKYIIYEQIKNEIQALSLDHKQYEQIIRIVANKLGI